MSPNPIVVREFRARWRHWHAFAIVFGYAVLLAVAVGLLYANNLRDNDVQDLSARRMAEIGHTLFLSLTATQVFAWMLLAPTLTSAAIAGEREEGMLDLLHMSPLRPRQIVLGKLSAALSFILLMMLAPLPITSLCFLMGGVSPGEFAVAALLQITTAVTGAAVGLVCSAWCRRAGTALTLAFIAVAVWGLGSAFATTYHWRFASVSFSMEPFRWIGYLIAEILGRTNPVIAVFSASSLSQPGVFIVDYYVPSWVLTVAFELVAISLLLYSASRAVRRPLADGPEPVARRRSRRRLGGEDANSPQTEVSETATEPGDVAGRVSSWWEWSGASDLHFGNPMLERELRRKLRLRRLSFWMSAFVRLLVAIGVLLYLWGIAYALSDLRGGAEGLFWMSLIFYMMIVSVAAASMGATAFPRERECRVWESLQLSLLTPWQIVSGKLIPIIIACLVPTLAVFFLLTPCLGSGGHSVYNPGVVALQWLWAIPIFCTVIWCHACWGMLISWRCRRSWIAVTTTLASMLFALIFVPVFFFMAYSYHSHRILEESLRLVHPFFALIDIASHRWNPDESKGLARTVLGFVVTYGGIGWICLGLLYQRVAASMREVGAGKS